MLLYLSYGVIRRIGSLKTFIATYTNADVRRLYHADVVGSIANCKRYDFDLFLNHLNNFRFLKRRNPEIRTNDQLAPLSEKRSFEMLLSWRVKEGEDPEEFYEIPLWKSLRFANVQFSINLVATLDEIGCVQGGMAVDPGCHFKEKVKSKKQTSR